MFTSYLHRTKILFTSIVIVWLFLIGIATKTRIIQRQVQLGQSEIQYLAYSFDYSHNYDNKSLAALVGNSLEQFGTVNYVAAENSSSSAEAIPVLLYHGIVSTPDRFSLTPQAFKDQMFALKRDSYEAIKISDFIAFIKGEKTLPPKSFLLTFDDGRSDSYRGADPVLKALNWSAVMFVATGQSFTNKTINPYYIDKNMARDMLSSGRWEIQSHAIQSLGGFIPLDGNGKTGEQGNLLSNKMWLADKARFETDDEYIKRINAELDDSKATIEKLLGTKVVAFAYPFSDYGQQTINNEAQADSIIRQAVSRDYLAAFRQTWETDDYFTWNYHDEDPYRLKRIETPTNWSGADLIKYLDSSAPKPLPYSDPLKENAGWKDSWGDYSVDANGLHIYSNNRTNGAFVFLDGSRPWSDYSSSVEATRNNGDYLSLFARYQSNDNYVSCTFSDKNVKIDEKVEGSVTQLDLQSKFVELSTSGAHYGITVVGGDVRCYVNNNLVAEAHGLSEKLSSGGIGFRVWNNDMNIKSEAWFKNLNVVQITPTTNTR